jgi:two-component system chemotaxis response regulator CheY
MSLFQKQPQPYDLSNLTIMIVEDSYYMQSLITQMLKVFGVGGIVVAASAEEAIDLLSVMQATKKSNLINSVDMVLTDWLMPKGSGEDLLKWIRTHKKDSVRFLPVIVISAYTTEFIASRSRDLGANETMVKPISGKGLAARICTVIDHPRPFISAPTYFGPDRRRQELPWKGTERRVTQAVEIKVSANAE